MLEFLLKELLKKKKPNKKTPLMVMPEPSSTGMHKASVIKVCETRLYLYTHPYLPFAAIPLQ